MPIYLLYDFKSDQVIEKSFILDNIVLACKERMRLFPDAHLILFKSIAHEYDLNYFEKLSKDWEDHLECIH